MPAYQRLQELGLSLPDAAASSSAVVLAIRQGQVVYVSGQTPREGTAMKYAGKVGAKLSVEEGYAAARLAALRCLSALNTIASLDQIRILKMTGFVNAAPEFTLHAKVINGASDLLVQVLGERGRHARSAIGLGSLPDDAAVEVELVAEVL